MSDWLTLPDSLWLEISDHSVWQDRLEIAKIGQSVSQLSQTCDFWRKVEFKATELFLHFKDQKPVWEHVIRALPFIQFLYWNYETCINCDTHCVMYHVISQFFYLKHLTISNGFHDGKLTLNVSPTLQSIDLFGFHESSLFDLLVNCPPVKKLGVSNLHYEDNNIYWTKILTLPVCQTLEILRFVSVRTVSLSSLSTIVNLPHLKHLIWYPKLEYVKWLVSRPIQDCVFLNQTVSLKKVTWLICCIWDRNIYHQTKAFVKHFPQIKWSFPLTAWGELEEGFLFNTDN